MNTEPGRPQGCFSEILDLVYNKSPLQKKRISKFVDSQGDTYRELADGFARDFLSYLQAENKSLEYAVDAYLKMCRDVMAEQMKFMKTGRYSCRSFAEARENVYNNEEAMKSYMYGLLLSQFLWKNHYMMFQFFVDRLREAGDIRGYLEIGSGHGLYLAQAIKMLPEADFTVVDISPVSIAMTRGIVKHVARDSDRLRFVQADVMEFAEPEKFDFVVMGEVLEHVEDPFSLLSAASRQIRPGGRLFVTTCANAPAIDHIYLYDSVEAITGMIGRAGLRIISDIMLPADDVPHEQWKEKRVAINYAAVVERGD